MTSLQTNRHGPISEGLNPRLLMRESQILWYQRLAAQWSPYRLLLIFITRLVHWGFAWTYPGGSSRKIGQGGTTWAKAFLKSILVWPSLWVERERKESVLLPILEQRQIFCCCHIVQFEDHHGHINNYCSNRLHWMDGISSGKTMWFWKCPCPCSQHLSFWWIQKCVDWRCHWFFIHKI